MQFRLYEIIFDVKLYLTNIARNTLPFHEPHNLSILCSINFLYNCFAMRKLRQKNQQV